MSHTLVIKGDLAQLKDVALKVMDKEFIVTLDSMPIETHRLTKLPSCQICHCTCSSYTNLHQHITNSHANVNRTPPDTVSVEVLARCIAEMLLQP
jgi:hypothetical protein